MKRSKLEQLKMLQMMTSPLVDEELPELRNPWGRVGFALGLVAEFVAEAVRWSVHDARCLVEGARSALDVHDQAKLDVKREVEAARRRMEN